MGFGEKWCILNKNSTALWIL